MEKLQIPRVETQVYRGVGEQFREAEEEMSATGGWTETFSIAGLEERRVVQTIGEFWEELG